MYYVKLDEITTIKQGDTKRVFTAQITDSTNTPVILTGATVILFIAKRNAVVLQKTATITSSTLGEVSFSFSDEDITGSGYFDAEFQVTFADLTRITAPTNDYMKIKINQKLPDRGNETITPSLYTQVIEAQTGQDAKITAQGNEIDVLSVEKAKKGLDVPANVLDFADLATGNDWTSAIQYALDNYNRVFIPKGRTYDISATLNVPNNKSLILEGKNARLTDSSKYGVLTPTNDIDVVSLGDCSTIEGGIISTSKVTTFSKSCVKIDYSTAYRYNNRVDTSLIGTGSGYGVRFYGNGDGGQGVGANVKGWIAWFDTGIKGEKVSGNCWYTGLFVDAFVLNCIQAINLDSVGSGGRLSGTFQPKIGATGTYNTIERALVELNTPNMIVDGLLWDINTAVNKYGIHLRSKALFPQILSASSLYIKNDLKYPFNNINKIEQNFDNAKIFPTRPITLRDTFTGMQDNILLGAHKKFTVTKTYDNSLIYLANSDNCFTGANSHVSIQLYGTAPKNINTPITYEITFDKTRHFHSMGFSFQGGYYPYYYKMHRKINGVYSVVKEGNPNEFFLDGKNNWSQHTAISSGRVTGDSDDAFVEGVKFEFIFNPSLDGKEILRLTNLFYKDGTTNENFLPAYGGKVFGDIEFNPGTGTIIKSPNGTKYRITVNDSGVLSTTIVT